MGLIPPVEAEPVVVVPIVEVAPIVVAPVVEVNEAEVRAHLSALMDAWIREYDADRLHGFEAVIAYLRLRYQPISILTPPLLVATRSFVAGVAGAIDRIQGALAPFPPVLTHQITTLFPAADPYRRGIVRRIAGHQREARLAEERRIQQARAEEDRRIRQEREAHRRAHPPPLVQQVRQRARWMVEEDPDLHLVAEMLDWMMGAEADMLEAFRAPLDRGAVVFARDPEGSVDLRALAADPQSIHRSSVQATAKTAIDALMKRPVPPAQNTVKDVTAAFSASFKEGTNRDHLIRTFTDDCRVVRAFDVSYKDVADRVWAFIATHKERGELVVRLAQEVVEGTGMCSNGKMARLTNVLQGYDEDLVVAPPKELFHDRMAHVSKMAAADRVAAARGLFVEFAIPEAEQAPWLEALED